MPAWLHASYEHCKREMEQLLNSEGKGANQNIEKCARETMMLALRSQSKGAGGMIHAQHTFGSKGQGGGKEDLCLSSEGWWELG